MALTESEKRQDKKEKPLTKVIIRRLPPTMTKEQFLNQVSPVPDYNYIYHVRGDMSLGENAFSRAYINFVCPEDVYGFKEKFDNYVFVDSKGHEYTAVVEFAPFQKIPKKRGKPRMDPKCNSVELDTYYLEFVANLNKPVEPNAKPEYTLQLERGDEKKKDITTPLLEFIKNKRAQKLKIREVRREEREKRKKEFERRKEHGKYYEEKKYDERSPAKLYGKKSHIKSPKSDGPKEQFKPENSEDKPGKPIKEKRDEKPPEKQSPESKPKEKKPEEKKEKKEIKPRFPKKEYTSDARDFKREDYSYRDYRSKHLDEYKKEETKTYPKKIKKYSEKREERKIEAQKAEQKKLEQQQAKNKDSHNLQEEAGYGDTTKPNRTNDKEIADPKENEDINKETVTITKQVSLEKENRDFDERSDAGSSSSRRIRNKDRPTIPLYRPGMLSKRKQNDPDDQKTEAKAEPKNE